MSTADIIASFSDPSAAGVRPAPTVDASPARRLRDAIEPIAMHSVWSETTTDRLGALGLDFMASYVISRAFHLGYPDPGTVSAAFAVFEPGMIRSMVSKHLYSVDRDHVLATRAEATASSLADALGDVDVEQVVAIAERLRDALRDADGAGRPLFSGLSTQPWPDDPFELLWRACEQAREHRGDGHVAACVASGLGPVEMNLLTELWVGMPFGSYTASRGWSPEAIERGRRRLADRGLVDGQALTSDGTAFRDDIEAATDTAAGSFVDALGPGLDDVIGQLDDWSGRCVAAGAFPDNPFKRAAG